MTAERTISAFNRLFREIRASSDLTLLTLGGVNMWPVLRLTAFHLHEAIIEKVQAPLRAALPRNPSETYAVCDGAETLALVTERLNGAALIGRSQASPVGVLAFQSDREVASPAQSREADSFSVGLQRAAASGGLSFACLTSFAPRLAPRLTHAEWLYTACPGPRIAQLAEMSSWLRSVTDICATFNSAMGSQLLHASHVTANALRLLSLVAPSETLLDRFSPRLLFTNGAFGIEKMAMITAGRKRGILCVDHQHGMYGSGSETFLSPLGAHSGGIDPTPDLAWVWSEWFAANYAGDPQAMPRIVGGSLTGGFEGQPAARRGAKAASETKTVLYLHQGLVSAYDPSPVPLVSAPVLETIRMSPPDWKWLIRLHPRWQGLAEFAESAAFKALPAELSGRLSFARPSQMPLAACLDAADAVLTGFSASACFAHDYGLPVVIHHPVGRDLFAPAIAEGRMAYAQDPGAILAALGRGAPAPPSELFVQNNLDLSRRAIMELWDMAPARPAPAMF